MNDRLPSPHGNFWKSNKTEMKKLHLVELTVANIEIYIHGNVEYSLRENLKQLNYLDNYDDRKTEDVIVLKDIKDSVTVKTQLNFIKTRHWREHI